mmetsp:Transcript_4243/g.7474  ORF Transcript_4243/g.7474 Transcript_4243/m.7474 type:complete len:317 (-) Transcript_4243:69-1019(-)
MGKKILAAGSGLGLFAVLTSVISLVLPIHKAHFYGAGFFPVFEMETYSLYAHFSSDTKDLLCRKFRGKICESGESFYLQDVQSSFCTGGAEQIARNGCSGTRCAYVMGIALVVAVVTNAIMQFVGAFLVSQYFTHSPKKQYREASLVLDVIGLLVLAIVVVIYYPTAIVNLDSIEVHELISPFVSKSRGAGLSIGYIIMWLSLLAQGISVVLQAFGQNTEEVRAADFREERKFMQEMQMFEQASALASGRTSAQPLQQQQVAHPYQHSPYPAMQQCAGQQGFGSMQAYPMGGNVMMQQPMAGFGASTSQGRGPPYF